ncbi:MAG: hypothetical protein OJJ21_16920 [Ferrovibrio sp.]|uniref:hypothetical protein n=1 Tax=Ferrovibrio sp. TaxID=1917215 RepID=UPI0026172AA2|nr:hypothetical protein [Ferrovibrio sp.]MCW0235284.1 hypothetical protein [Ferrovibrio sp.]
MGYLSETARAAAEGRSVWAVILVYLDFTSGPIRVCLSDWDVVSAGQTWQALGKLGSISAIDVPMNGTAPIVTLTLSGVDPAIVPKALNSSDEVKGRGVAIYVQFKDSNFQNFDSPYALFIGTMDQMSIDGSGVDTRTIEVSVEWLFTRRAIPPFAYLSDRDQKTLFPGDRGLEFMASMQSKTIEWPIY